MKFIFKFTTQPSNRGYTTDYIEFPVMAAKPSQESLRRAYSMGSSDDEDTPSVIVFDESSYGIRKKTDASGAVISKGKPIKAAPIDLDTSNVVPASKKHVMDAEE